jgi:hypothetical protein
MQNQVLKRYLFLYYLSRAPFCNRVLCFIHMILKQYDFNKKFNRIQHDA